VNKYENNRKAFICANRVSKHPINITIMDALNTSNSDEEFEKKLSDGIEILSKEYLDE